MSPPSVLEQVESSLCDKQVVLLGESGYHGDGATEEFKSRLIPKLVQNCGFTLILFESSFYQFAKINEDLSQGEEINSEDIGNAIGGLWKNDREIQNLINFLTNSANEGVLTIAGIDDQLSGRGQDYANFQMPNDVVQGLPPSIAEACKDLLERRIIQNYPDGDSYSRRKKKKLLDCFSTTSENQFVNSMRSSVHRYIARDFDTEKYFAGRAKSMFLNFEYLFDSQLKPPKTIIWTATVHAAKSRGYLKGNPNMGTYLHKRFGDQGFVLGFSALGGQYRKMTGKVFQVPQAPKDSLEFQAMDENKKDVTFLKQKELEAFGTVPASIYSYKYETDDWSDILDGLVVFRQQRPTEILKRLE